MARVLVDGMAFGEGPRWHEGRLWCSDMHRHLVMAVELDGRVETVCEVPGQPSGLGWLPDGRLLVVSMTDRRVLRLEHDGALVVHADLSTLASWHCNDMVVDLAGRAYVGNFGFDIFVPDPVPAPAELVAVEPDGSARLVADDLRFPNGAVITPDDQLIVAETGGGRLTAFDIGADGDLSGRRVWADLAGGVPDGICLDADGAVWYADPRHRAVVRVAEGGAELDRYESDQGCYACALGGPERRTLFVLTSGTSEPAAAASSRSARVELTEVAVGGAGLP